MSKNPNWTIDELILSLDLYLRVNPIHTNENHPEIVKLSELLNSLPIHPRKTKRENFRNPNGVYMKLCNFLRFDPNYHGKVSLQVQNLKKLYGITMKKIERNYQILSEG
jgi:5-methylcytosine-specific restriction enzyme A